MLQSDREGDAQEGSVFAHEGEASGPSGGNLSQSAGAGGGRESRAAGKKCLQLSPPSPSPGKARVRG